MKLQQFDEIMKRIILLDSTCNYIIKKKMREYKTHKRFFQIMKHCRQ